MKHSWILVAGVLLAGCVAAPEKRAPQQPKAATWQESASQLVAAPADLSAWWTTFGDAQLDELVRRAADANHDVRAAVARVREARARAGIVRGDLLPQLDASASATRNRFSENGLMPLPKPHTNLYSLGYDASWEIDVFGATRAELAAANAEVDAALADRRDVLVTLLGDVARAYVELRGSQRLASVARRNIDAARETLELTRTRNQGGLATELDVSRAEALLARAQAPLPQYDEAQRVALHRLGVLLGETPAALANELADERPVPTPPERILVGLPSDLLTRRADVRRAQSTLAAADARIGAAVADQYPRFSLTGGFGLESTHTSDFADAASRAWSVGPLVRWPIFAGGAIRANIEAQDARSEAALASYEKTMLVALEEVENAFVGYLREWDHRRALEANASANRRSVELADALFRGGLTGFLDVLDAERSLHDAELELARSEMNTTLEVVQLYKALGGGWESFEGGRGE